MDCVDKHIAGACSCAHTSSMLKQPGMSVLNHVFVMLQSDDQGLVNTDPRTIAVPDSYINNIPTDVRGLSFSRTPQQLINMYSLGNPDGVGPFFPNGLVGAINKPTGYTNMAGGLEDFPSEPYLATQVLIHMVLLVLRCAYCRTAIKSQLVGLCCLCFHDFGLVFSCLYMYMGS